MTQERFGFRRVRSNFGEQSIVLEVVQFDNVGNWSILHFNKKDNKYITDNIIITNELYGFLMDNQLTSVVRVNKDYSSTLKFVRCVLQLTPKALIKSL
jgi:hypothetical protein